MSAPVSLPSTSPSPLPSFDAIDLSAPWLSHLTDIHLAFKDSGHLPLYDWLNHYFYEQRIALANHQKQPLSFTHQNDLAHGTAYEAHIGTHHKIPTRDNLHDWFGACIWQAFPKTKALLNAKHLQHLHADSQSDSANKSANKRNRVRDTITIFDENGVVLVVSDDDVGDEIATALVNFNWQRCLIDHHQHWHNPSPFNNPNDVSHPNHPTKAQAVIFGHALLEQLTHPYKSLCGHAFVIKMHSSFFGLPMDKQLSRLDNILSIELDKFLIDTVTPKQLNPLPILGVPYFWDNDDRQFYDDPFVFRQGRKK